MRLNPVRLYRLIILLPFFTFILTACHQQAPDNPSEALADAADDTPMQHSLKHADPSYVCPMHPQIVKGEPGNCPICGMNLVEKIIDSSGLSSSLPSIASASAPQPSESMASAMKDSQEQHAAKHTDPKYVCPMHPQIVKDEPGSCPICGMNLVEKIIETKNSDQPAIQINSSVIQSMGVRTQVATKGALQTRIRTVGRVDYDETRLAHIHPRTSGWMEKLYFRAEGDPVKRGQKLGDLYSPEVLSAQVDYLIALDQTSSLSQEKARNRLRLLGVSESTIKRIEKRRKTQNTVPVYSPAKGVMTLLTAREGMYVQPEMEIFTIADLSRVWVLVDVFEHQIDWLTIGDLAQISVPAFPGKTWAGKVDYIYPELDPVSRTLRVRLAFDNPDYMLKANMFADIVIEGSAKTESIIVPAQALIETGERTTLVIALGEGRFQPIDVETGIRSNGRVAILSGIDEGDKVVVSGQFLIDSESSLQASFMRMVGGE